jgi:hypothetical protein
MLCCFSSRIYPTSTGFGWGNLRERHHWGDPGVDGRIILNVFSGIGMWKYGVDRVGSA